MLHAFRLGYCTRSILALPDNIDALLMGSGVSWRMQVVRHDRMEVHTKDGSFDMHIPQDATMHTTTCMIATCLVLSALSAVESACVAVTGSVTGLVRPVAE